MRKFRTSRSCGRLALLQRISHAADNGCLPENRVGPNALLGEQRAAARNVIATRDACCTTKRLPDGQPPLSACHAKGGNVGTRLLLFRPSILALGLSAIWLGSCTSLSPLRPNT